jgi:hypothetical protein
LSAGFGNDASSQVESVVALLRVRQGCRANKGSGYEFAHHFFTGSGIHVPEMILSRRPQRTSRACSIL